MQALARIARYRPSWGAPALEPSLSWPAAGYKSCFQPWLQQLAPQCGPHVVTTWPTRRHRQALPPALRLDATLSYSTHRRRSSSRRSQRESAGACGRSCLQSRMKNDGHLPLVIGSYPSPPKAPSPLEISSLLDCNCQHLSTTTPFNERPLLTNDPS